MEGRDIGTKVFPDADVKIFLDAQPEVRQSRRILQRGAEEDREQARREAAALLERDMRDRTRTVSPLVPAEDAEIIDSSHMSVDEVVARAEQLARAKLRQ